MRSTLSQYTKPYTITPKKEWCKEKLFKRTKGEVLKLCKKNPLPGTEKWGPDNPIWDCYVAGKKSPREGWKDETLLKKAIDNLFWITKKSIKLKQYDDFVDRIKNSFKSDLATMREIQLRFTIAKICPKVTALMPNKFTSIIEESGIDISVGVFCPMAGFGGIIRGAEAWFKKRRLTPKIEAYDINPNLCKYYGWTQRDLLSGKIKTDKIVVVCPPFGLNTERWPGTPEERDDDFETNYLDFHDWCKLIKKYIKAPNYIFIGPELRGKSKYASGKTPNGLFIKKYGIQYYPEYSTSKHKISKPKAIF